MVHRKKIVERKTDDTEYEKLHFNPTNNTHGLVHFF